MPNDITHLLVEWAKGDKEALEELMPMVYQELRRMANHYIRFEGNRHTLQPTELVHEVYMRIIDQQRVNWRDRTHFYAISALMMRRVLVNYAIAKQAIKRGGKELTIALDEAMGLPVEQDINIVALDDALKGLAAIDERKSQIVELRYFGGLTLEEIADVLKISLTTAKRDWRLAKAWLYRELSGERGDHADEPAGDQDDEG